MTRQEFLAKWKHELSGMVLDGAEQRSGAAYSLWCRGILRKADALLEKMYEDLAGTRPIPAPNGQPQTKGATSEQPITRAGQPGR